MKHGRGQKVIKERDEITYSNTVYVLCLDVQIHLMELKNNRVTSLFFYIFV